MSDRFTDRARRIMDGAYQVAEKCGHPEFGVGHILAAIVTEGFGAASTLLTDRGIGLSRIDAELSSVAPSKVRTPPRPSEALKTGFSNSIKLADEMESRFVGPDLLLLGILETDEARAPILRRIGLNAVAFNAEIRKAMAKSAEGVRKTGVINRELGHTTRRETTLFRKGKDGTQKNRLAGAAKRILALGRQEAVMMETPKVSTGHLILGMLADPARVEHTFWKGLVVDLDALRARVKEIALSNTAETIEDNSPMTSQSREVLELAAQEADDVGDDEVEVVHVLLGLLKHSGCAATRALTDLGCDLHYLRALVDAEMK